MSPKAPTEVSVGPLGKRDQCGSQHPSVSSWMREKFWTLLGLGTGSYRCEGPRHCHMSVLCCKVTH